MFTSLKNTKKGFTLIELLVVIAIIGILSSVVLASLSTARQKSRDAKRISDIGQIQLALELFFDANQSYPSTTPGCPGGAVCTTNANLEAAVSLLTNKGFLPQSPTPPAGPATNVYFYRALYTNATPATDECIGVGTACTSYFLAAPLERSDNTVLGSDADVTLAAPIVAYAAAPRLVGIAGGILLGNSGTCIAAGSPDTCYDVKP